MFKNFWWPLAHSREATAKPVRITALQQEFVLVRLPGGIAQVLSDLCVHRGGALSDGWLAGDCLVCPYHGWQFKADGACVKIPANAAGVPVPRKARVDSYPTTERNGMVWAYLGDLPEAERPPLPMIEATEDAPLASGIIQYKAPYAYVIAHFARLEHAALAPGHALAGQARVSTSSAAVTGAWHASAKGRLGMPKRISTALLGLLKREEKQADADAICAVHAPSLTVHSIGSARLVMSHSPVDEITTETRWAQWPAADVSAEQAQTSTRAALEAMRAAIESGKTEASPFADVLTKWQHEATKRGWRIDTHLIQAEYANIKAVVIPSPARREVPELAAAWVLKEVPTK